VAYDYNKPLMIPASVDSLAQIGHSGGSMSASQNLGLKAWGDQWHDMFPFKAKGTAFMNVLEHLNFFRENRYDYG
jgi:hypothetical protein